MELKKTKDIYSLSIGETVTKRNLFDLIQYSKVSSSTYWNGFDDVIGNTPQQGINWIGNLPVVSAVIIKTRPGSYKEDGWNDENKSIYHYSFKARKGKISFKEKANLVLLKQPQHLYPVFLFTELKDSWLFEGKFSVQEIDDTYVVLQRISKQVNITETIQEEIQYTEGDRRYVTHLMAERNKEVVAYLKKTNTWVCDICNIDFNEKYGVHYIEAHHKIPMSNFLNEYKIKPKDLALLCPNCHKAVHVYMKTKNIQYEEIKKIINFSIKK
jgi:putative restriction endonuclease